MSPHSAPVLCTCPVHLPMPQCPCLALHTLYAVHLSWSLRFIALLYLAVRNPMQCFKLAVLHSRQCIYLWSCLPSAVLLCRIIHVSVALHHFQICICCCACMFPTEEVMQTSIPCTPHLHTLHPTPPYLLPHTCYCCADACAASLCATRLCATRLCATRLCVVLLAGSAYAW